jgi:hypothetical protein
MMRSIAVLLLLTCSTAGIAADSARLQAAADSSPHSARITGPKRLTDLAKATYSKWVGCSYSIDWGDGSFSPSGPVGTDCALGLSHTYGTSGTYRIRAKTFHPASDDHHTDDWSDAITFKAK